MSLNRKDLELNFGPAPLRKWASNIANAIWTTRPKSGTGTTVDEGSDGMPINVNGSGGDEGGDGSGGGDDELGVHTLDVCHMGAPAKRDFRCSEPYTD